MVLSVIGVSDEERERALQLWEVADADSTTIEHAGRLPANYMRFRMDEREARQVRTLDTVLVPGLLQTSAYASANAAVGTELLFDDWDSTAEAAERRDRQNLIHRQEDPLSLHALIDEVALRRVVGGPDVMVEQIEYLSKMASLPHVTIQVIPLAVGSYGVTAGPLVLLRFPEDDEPDSAYVESLLGMHMVENQQNARVLSNAWDHVARLALSPDETGRFIDEARDWMTR
ncbi:MAG: DUF5753 domain-containing protein [Actinomycetota bacterium]|nr:DUF5753 domain-containing protein [Actinomycetota bacterium]